MRGRRGRVGSAEPVEKPHGRLPLSPGLRPFAEVYGKRGAIVSAVDLVRGVGVLLGWKRIDVPGATGYLDTDYAANGRAGVAALKDHDLVCVHVEATDEASHEGRATTMEIVSRTEQGRVGLEVLPSYAGFLRERERVDEAVELETRLAELPTPSAA